MGAWGPGPFENDAALDFIYEIQSSTDLVRAFEQADSDYVEVDEGSAIIVAAECVAALCGSPRPDLPEELANQIAGFPKPGPNLLALARQSLAAVRTDSELAELWDEGEASEASTRFHAEMAGLAERLDAAVQAG